MSGATIHHAWPGVRPSGLPGSAVSDSSFFFSSRRRHTRSDRDWSSDVCSSDLIAMTALFPIWKRDTRELIRRFHEHHFRAVAACVDTNVLAPSFAGRELDESLDRKSVV